MCVALVASSVLGVSASADEVAYVYGYNYPERTAFESMKNRDISFTIPQRNDYYVYMVVQGFLDEFTVTYNGNPVELLWRDDNTGCYKIDVGYTIGKTYTINVVHNLEVPRNFTILSIFGVSPWVTSNVSTSDVLLRVDRSIEDDFSPNPGSAAGSVGGAWPHVFSYSAGDEQQVFDFYISADKLRGMSDIAFTFALHSLYDNIDESEAWMDAYIDSITVYHSGMPVQSVVTTYQVTDNLNAWYRGMSMSGKELGLFSSDQIFCSVVAPVPSDGYLGVRVVCGALESTIAGSDDDTVNRLNMLTPVCRGVFTSSSEAAYRGSVLNGFAKVYEWFQKLRDDVVAAIGNMSSKIQSALTSLWNNISARWDSFQSWLESVLDADSSVIDDSSDQILDDVESIEKIEQDLIIDFDDNAHVITDTFDLSSFASALAFCGSILSGTFAGLGSYRVVLTLPLAIGLVLFVCSRVPGRMIPPRYSGPGKTDGTS